MVNPRCGRLRPYEHRTNYYLHYYSPGMADLFPLRATSHSGMVGGKDRRQREIEFRKPDGMYNVMVATPTMELGIDIGDLSSVYLRNVPPNPANYAQRTGRAGRSGQGALSVAFCGSGPGRGSHDQYFYRFPEKIVSGSISVPRFNLDNKTLTKAHVNSLVLQTINVKLQNRADYVLEIQEDGHKKEPLYPMKLDYKQSIEREVERQRIRVHEAVKEAFESETLDRPWFSDDFIFGAIDEFTDTLDRAFDPWRIDYRDTAQELQMKQAQQFKEPTEQLKYATGHLAKRLQMMREGKDRFNVYNYLRHVGFLPNYAFPRSDVVLKFSDSSDDIHRDRLIGLSEFAPMNTVYYEGGKHMVKTAFMDEKSKLIKIKVCTSCTTVMRGDLTKGSICPSCGSSLEVVHASEALQLPNMKAIRRERITADEEERLRRGFKIAHTYIPGNNVRSLAIKRNDSPIATLSFERTADLLHVNMGPFATLESFEERPGFFLCRACGNWLSSRQIEKHYDANGRDYCYRGGEKKELLSQLQLFVESAHDVLTFEPVADFVAGDVDSFATTLLYALQRGISLALDLDSSELDGFVQNVGNGKRRVVIYETAEGGTGTLRSILSVKSLRRIAENILELIHYEPDGSESDGACERACYDCLCTFYNQREHRLLHRALIRDFLGLLRNATSLVGKPSEDERYKQMYEESNRGERNVLQALREGGYRIPDEHHKIIYEEDIPLIESDFYYEPNIVVLVHGSVHHLKYVRDMDQDKEAKVQSLGYIMVVVEPNNIENLISLLG